MTVQDSARSMLSALHLYSFVDKRVSLSGLIRLVKCCTNQHISHQCVTVKNLMFKYMYEVNSNLSRGVNLI